MSATAPATDTAPDHPVYEVEAHDLPVSCPGPHTPVWNLHPKVYLDVATSGSAQCPYCGSLYRLKPGARVGGH